MKFEESVHQIWFQWHAFPFPAKISLFGFAYPYAGILNNKQYIVSAFKTIPFNAIYFIL